MFLSVTFLVSLILVSSLEQASTLLSFVVSLAETACIRTNRREYVNSKLTHLHQTYFVREFTVSVQFMSWIYSQTSGFDNLSSVTSFLKY